MRAIFHQQQTNSTIGFSRGEKHYSGTPKMLHIITTTPRNMAEYARY
jgi:hypothetical protein